MTTLSLGDLLPCTDPEPNNQPHLDQKPEPTPDPIEFTPHHRHPEFLFNQHGIPVAYQYETDAPATALQMDSIGILWAGETIVGHFSDTGALRPAMEMPVEATPAIINTIARALRRSNTYVFNDLLQVAASTPEDTHHLRPLHSFSAFDAHLSASIAFITIKTTKGKTPEDDDFAFRITPLNQRLALAVFASQSLKELLPQILAQNPVSLPYHPTPSKNTVEWNPPGYNPENQTYTNNLSAPLDRTPVKALIRWHRKLTHTFLWDTPEDYHAYLAQTLSATVTELLTPLPVNGVPGERAVMPASLIESGSTQGASGKSILTKLAALGPYGVVRGKVPPSKEEVPAFIVTALDKGERCIFLDECKDVIADSLLTAVSDEGGGRLKGVSREVYGDLHVMLAAANPTYSSMMSRRILSCKVRTRPDYLTHQFNRYITKSNLPELRPLMLSLTKALIDQWASKGCPLATPNSQWPEYSALVGGIMEANDIPNPLHTKIAALSYDESDSDHIDAQWPTYFKLVASGELTFGSYDNPRDIEGEHAAGELLNYAQAAGFYPQLRDDTGGRRNFVKSLSTWLSSDDPLHGYRMIRKRKSAGISIIFEKILASDTESTTNKPSPEIGR